ncbi:MAG: 50S ribosomal protein L40e [Candidatus Asgardarchaeia archaeon]
MSSSLDEFKRKLAHYHLLEYMICRKCYARNPRNAKKCRRCHSKRLRPKKKEK